MWTAAVLTILCIEAFAGSRVGLLVCEGRSIVVFVIALSVEPNTSGVVGTKCRRSFDAGSSSHVSLVAIFVWVERVLQNKNRGDNSGRVAGAGCLHESLTGLCCVDGPEGQPKIA